MLSILGDSSALEGSLKHYRFLHRTLVAGRSRTICRGNCATSQERCSSHARLLSVRICGWADANQPFRTSAAWESLYANLDRHRGANNRPEPADAGSAPKIAKAAVAIEGIPRGGRPELVQSCRQFAVLESDALELGDVNSPTLAARSRSPTSKSRQTP